MTIEELLARTEKALDDLEQRGGGRREPDPRDVRKPSRFANQHATLEHVKRLAEGGHTDDHDPTGGGRKQLEGGERRERKGNELMLGIKSALAEGTMASGGYLVPVQYATEILTLIRARSAVSQMGITRIEGINRELDLNSIATGSTAAYVPENAVIPVSSLTFGQAAFLRPIPLAALLAISNRLIRDTTNPSVDAIVQNDVAEVIALREDLACLTGVGTTEPLGILNTPGLTPGPSLGANGRTPTFDDLKAMPAALRAINAGFMRPGWIFNPRLLDTLEKIQITSGGSPTGQYLGDSPGLLKYDVAGGGGTLLGYPFRTTTQLPTNVHVGTSTDCSTVIFSSDWQEAYEGVNEDLRLELSAEASYTPDGGATWVSAFQSDQTLTRAIVTHDFALRRPQLFTTLAGVRP